MNFVKVAEPSDLPEGAMKRVVVGAARVTLANAGGSIYAFDDECTHDGGPLSEGELRDCVVTCPWHFSSFDIRTGEIVDSPAEEPIPVYEVKVTDDGIYVGGPVDRSLS